MVEKVAKVDPEKRYITGISMGGMVTVATGCADTKRWRGMVPVAMLSNPCAKVDRPIPHLAFHATGDQLTSYEDDKKLASEMAPHNGCNPTPETVYYGGPKTSTEVACFKEAYGLGSPDARPIQHSALRLPAGPSGIELLGLDRLQRRRRSAVLHRGCEHTTVRWTPALPK